MSTVGTFLFGPPPAAALPERTRAAISRQQIESERLIGWVQLAMVTIFAILYAVAPKTSAGTAFKPVPWALGLYFGFTLLRLGFVHRGIVPDALMLASGAVDMTLLMALIWSFHLQYQQPASFYLKAPTMLYVFIFIALRALRFDPRYVVAAGLSAALGWLALLAYALDDGSGSMPITRDYVRYMTSNMVLIGGEVDKIISILMVTAILGVALVRAKRLLSRAIADAVVAKDLSRFVAPEVASRIASAEREIRPGDGEVKTATVLFTDIEGFSTLAEKLPPGILMATMNDYFGAVAAIIDRHDGVITQYQGDAMLIAFNTARPNPTHAANAVRVAQGIQALVNGRTFGNGAVLKTRCGINTGEIVHGAVGSKDRLIFTVHGDEVNVAARLEKLNKDYRTYILAGERTVKEAGPEFAFERVGEVAVRGRAGATTIYALRT